MASDIKVTTGPHDIGPSDLPRDERGRWAWDFVCYAATGCRDKQAAIDLALSSADEHLAALAALRARLAEAERQRDELAIAQATTLADLSTVVRRADHAESRLATAVEECRILRKECPGDVVGGPGDTPEVAIARAATDALGLLGVHDGSCDTSGAPDATALGDEELMKAYEAAHARERWICYHRPNPSGLRAVAAAVQARGGVKVSGLWISTHTNELGYFKMPVESLIHDLKKAGVTIEEARP